MMLDYNDIGIRASYEDSIKVIEADIHYSNVLAGSIPRAKDGAYLKMKLVYSDGRPHISSCRRKATIREFYTVILPSLQHLHDDSAELDTNQEKLNSSRTVFPNELEKKRKTSDIKFKREDECGICLEPCTKMVLPNCCHSMCINCYHNWNTRSESCPFCRGSLKRVNSSDLWVLTCSHDVVDTQTVLKEEMYHFSLI